MIYRIGDFYRVSEMRSVSLIYARLRSAQRIIGRERTALKDSELIASYELLIVDELGFVPLSKTGAELLFEMLSQRY
jgi:DNA replication protein DnaC